MVQCTFNCSWTLQNLKDSENKQKILHYLVQYLAPLRHALVGQAKVTPAPTAPSTPGFCDLDALLLLNNQEVKGIGEYLSPYKWSVLSDIHREITLRISE
jgi:hypothetical protein